MLLIKAIRFIAEFDATADDGQGARGLILEIVAGRDFTLADTRQVRHVVKPFEMMPATVMINQTFARRHFSGRNPVGLHIGFGGDPGTATDVEIIGVVKDIKYTVTRPRAA